MEHSSNEEGSYAGADVRAARARMASVLQAAGKGDAREDARRLVAHALGVEPSRLAFEPHRPLTAAESAAIGSMEAERLRGRSVARILGRRAFHDVVLEVRDDVLEPRDDTTALVELALGHLRGACDAHGAASVWDIGCGSGAVVLSLLVAEPRAVGLATDVSPGAIAATLANAASLGIPGSRLRVERRDGVDGRAADRHDLVVSNPPYVPTTEIASLPAEVLADPVEALDGGPDGLDFYRLLADRARPFVRPGGLLVVEIGAGQGAGVRELMDRGGWRFAHSRVDLAGHERALAFGPVEHPGMSSGGLRSPVAVKGLGSTGECAT